MTQPRAIILSGYGLNCEEETAHVFTLAGAKADIVHINDLVNGVKSLRSYQILAIPGGFSYGDDTGSGRAYANKLKNHLHDELNKFVTADKLVIGICNGFQILTQAGLLPGALLFNSNARYTARWVDLQVPHYREIARSVKGLPEPRRSNLKVGKEIASRKTGKNSLAISPTQGPWLAGIKSLMLPIAHGEGRYYNTAEGIKQLQKDHVIALEYSQEEICRYQNLEPNPNGAVENIAAVTGYNGRVLGMMPHPERAAFFTQLPHWPLLKEQMIRRSQPLPTVGPGLQIFKNAINYFK